MTHSLIIAEGLDDMRVAHEVLLRQCGLKQLRDATPWFGQARSRVFQTADCQRTIHLTYTDGKDAAAQTAQEWLVEGKAARQGIDRLGLIFDPDSQDDADCQRWFKKEVLKGLTAAPATFGYRLKVEEISIEVVPVAWDAGPGFDSLPQQMRNLERVALAVLQHSGSADADLILRLLSMIQADGRKTSWKTALRLWNALLSPGTEDSFFSRVFGQERPLSPSIEPVLSSTQILPLLRFLSGC